MLLVEEREVTADSLGRLLHELGWEVFPVHDTQEAFFAAEVLATRTPPGPEAIVADVTTDARAELLDCVRTALPDAPLILVTGGEDLARSAHAIAVLHLPVAVKDLEEVLALALSSSRRRPSHGESSMVIAGIVGVHGALAEALRMVMKVAPSSATVLIQGETGTGKELIARAIHALSRRPRGPFVAVNCAAIPETLLESELFGHEKGSFTGAVGRKQGLAERANGGTLFLDEIGDLPLSLQPKLLRMLQEREVLRVGGDAPVPVDARVVVATHRDLAASCENGTFREDLYWRLNVFPIELPPLRERATDIPILAEHFLRDLAIGEGRAPKRIHEDALARLCVHAWPGNIRELHSVIERASLMADGDEIRVEDLPPAIRSGRAASPSSAVRFRLPDSGFSLEAFERELFREAMRRSNGVVAAAARILGVTYRTMQGRLKKYGIDD